jgi:hypothetical protein
VPFDKIADPQSSPQVLFESHTIKVRFLAETQNVGILEMPHVVQLAYFLKSEVKDKGELLYDRDDETIQFPQLAFVRKGRLRSVEMRWTRLLFSCSQIIHIPGLIVFYLSSRFPCALLDASPRHEATYCARYLRPGTAAQIRP